MTQHASPAAVPERFRLPSERDSLTHRFTIADFKGYLTIGFYPDGRIGEVFIEAEKQGSTLSGVLGAFGRSISIGLQHGIPIDHFTQSFKYMRFTPEGMTGNRDVRNASSIMDYIFKYLEYRLNDGYLEDIRKRIEDAPPIQNQKQIAEERQDQFDIDGDDTFDSNYRSTSSRESSTPAELRISCKTNS